jgi:hypothetical protein
MAVRALTIELAGISILGLEIVVDEAIDVTLCFYTFSCLSHTHVLIDWHSVPSPLYRTMIPPPWGRSVRPHYAFRNVNQACANLSQHGNSSSSCSYLCGARPGKDRSFTHTSNGMKLV